MVTAECTRCGANIPCAKDAQGWWQSEKHACPPCSDNCLSRTVDEGDTYWCALSANHFEDHIDRFGLIRWRNLNQGSPPMTRAEFERIMGAEPMKDSSTFDGRAEELKRRESEYWRDVVGDIRAMCLRCGCIMKMEYLTITKKPGYSIMPPHVCVVSAAVWCTTCFHYHLLSEAHKPMNVYTLHST